jgi:hypothetical protein
MLFGAFVTQLDTRDPMVPSKVCLKGPISVRAEDPHNILLVHVVLFNVGLMVVLKILHTSFLDMIEPAKLQFSYT